jgi:hypothetical protein
MGYRTSTAENTETLILKTFTERDMKLTAKGGVHMGPDGKGRIYVIDDAFWYLLKWEAKPFAIAWLEVNKEAHATVIPEDSPCRTLNIAAFEQFVGDKPAAVLFASKVDIKDRPTNVIKFITSDNVKKWGFKHTQKANGEEVYVLEDSHMEDWTKGDDFGDGEEEKPSSMPPPSPPPSQVDYVPVEDEEQSIMEDFLQTSLEDYDTE